MTDLRQLMRSAVRQGWKVQRTGGGHLAWCSPAGAVVFSASTPSDWRALQNHKAHLRKHGWVEKQN
jgi:hypothetical protein